MFARLSPRATRGLFVALFAIACAIVFAGFAHAAPEVLPSMLPLTEMTLPPLDGLAVGAPLLAPTPVAVPKGTLDKLKAKLAALNPFAEGKEAEVDAAIAEMLAEQDAPAPPITATPPSVPAGDIAAQVTAAVQAAVAPLKQQVDGLTQALSDEQAARKAAQEALTKQQATEQTAKVTKLLDEAVGKGQIETAKREEWKTRLETDFEGMSAVLGELPANPALAKSQGSGDQKPNGGTISTTTATPDDPRASYNAARESALGAFQNTSATA